MNVRKIIHILGVSLALVALLVFGTAAVGHWHNPDSASEVQCQYCHLGHQTAVQPESAQCVAMLLLVASLPLPEDAVPATRPVFSQTAPRAPPAA
jgi:hypothetical protein